MKRILQGKSLGHPLHPLLVHLPIGLLVMSWILDLFNLPTVGREPSLPLDKCAMYMIGLGLIGMIIASIPGLVDYTVIRADSPAKWKGWVHLWMNALSFLCFAGSFVVRWSYPNLLGPPLVPMAMSTFGVGFLGYGGYLGGQMIYEDGIAVGRHRREGKTPVRTISARGRDGEFVPVIPASELVDRQTLRVNLNGTIISVAKVDGQLYAFQEFCTHRFGPLSEGCLHDGKVTCPWHGSTFDMQTGQVAKGPAKMPIKTFEIVERDGQIMIRQPRLPAGVVNRQDRPGAFDEQQWKDTEADQQRWHVEPRVDADGKSIE